MLGRRYWVDAGKIGNFANDDATYSLIEERKRFDLGQVRLTTGDLGTEIKWHVQSPCHASLYAAIEWLATARAPFVLRFYVSGWFEEERGKMYVSRGLGNSILPIRFNCRPEVAFIRVNY